MSLYGRFYFRPGEGETLTTRLCCSGNPHGAVLGAVCTSSGEAVPGALALLFRVPDEGEIELIDQFSTDEEGHFFFGPLESGALYLIKVFKSSLELRELEIASV
ncbi:MAG: hypothetical protein ACOX81_06415 [Candidatus Heteroscillospira sp.]|jgi:hypothetical protein